MGTVTDLDRAAGPASLSPREVARITALLDRLDPRVGEPGSVPGEVIVSPGRTGGPRLAA